MMQIEDETENRGTDIEVSEEIPIPGDPESAKKTLIELCAGIILYGVLSEIAAVWFFEDKAAASIVFWIGIVTALCMALHMYVVLDRTLTGAQAQNAVVRTLSVHNMIRYIVVIIVLVVVQYRGSASPVITFFGIMGLKAGAYLQPFVHKAILYLKPKAAEMK